MHGQMTEPITVGMDEVGRGSWAGPLVVGAAVLGAPIPGIADSKILAPSRRQELDTTIRNCAAAVGLGWVQPAELDELGLSASLRLAYSRALSMIHVRFDVILIDGNVNYLPGDERAQTLINADSLKPAVSAASIIAKVARDAYMVKAALLYPGYGFERHVGYGTEQHRHALDQFGLTPLHRRSFKPITLYTLRS